MKLTLKLGKPKSEPEEAPSIASEASAAPSEASVLASEPSVMASEPESEVNGSVLSSELNSEP